MKNSASNRSFFSRKAALADNAEKNSIALWSA
jgi:hypothetical protein